MCRAKREQTAALEIMTASEVADYLRVPLKSLYTWRYTHDGPPSARVGKYLRYRRTEVDEWLRAQTRFNRVDGPACCGPCRSASRVLKKSG